MRRPGMRRSSDGRFVSPCPECMRRYKRNREWRDMLSTAAAVIAFLALIYFAMHFGWLSI